MYEKYYEWHNKISFFFIFNPMFILIISKLCF